MDNYGWLDGYLQSLDCCEKDYKAEWGWFRYMIGGKMFAALCEISEKYSKFRPGKILTLKCDPLMVEAMRNQYESIVPGFYCNKQHFISIYLDSTVPDDVMKLLCREAHRLMAATLTKKKCAEMGITMCSR